MPDKRSISTKWLPRQGMKKAPVVCRDIRQATGGLWESRERRRVRVTFMAKWVRLHPSEPLLWGNALHSFDFQLFRFLSCYFLFITQKHHTFVWRFCCASFSSTHFGAGSRTRTDTMSPPTDFESVTSTNSIIPADTPPIIHDGRGLGKGRGEEIVKIAYHFAWSCGIMIDVY